MNHSAAKQAAARKPGAFVILPPTAFCDGWSQKPTADVAVGLLLLSEAQFESAKLTASEVVDKAYAARRDGYAEQTGAASIDFTKAAEAWNEAFFANVAAFATCDPNDVTRPYFPYAEDTITKALRPEGIRLVWDALDRHNIASSPNTPALADEQIADLVGRLPRLSALPGIHERRLRRLLGYVLDELTKLDPIES